MLKNGHFDVLLFVEWIDLYDRYLSKRYFTQLIGFSYYDV